MAPDFLAEDFFAEALFDEDFAALFRAEAFPAPLPAEPARPAVLLARAASLSPAAATVAPAFMAMSGALSATFFATAGAFSATVSATRLTAPGARAATFRATPGALSATFFATVGAFSATFFATAGALDATAASAWAAWSARSFALLLTLDLLVCASLSARVVCASVTQLRPRGQGRLGRNSHREAYALAGMASTRSGGGSDRPRAPHEETPRVRDLPEPRRTESAIGPLFRTVFKWPYRIALAGLYRAGLRAWQLTVLSLLANAVIGWLLITGRFLISGLLLIVAGLLDIFDGGLARLRGEASRAGAFLDSVIDRVSDLILFGALFWALAGQGHRTAAAFALSSLIVSLLVSHIRAEGEAMGLSLTEGVFQRLERYVMLMIGLTAPGTLLPVLVILTTLGGLTILQRLVSAWRQLTEPAERARNKSDKIDRSS